MPEDFSGTGFRQKEGLTHGDIRVDVDVEDVVDGGLVVDVVGSVEVDSVDRIEEGCVGRGFVGESKHGRLVERLRKRCLSSWKGKRH